MKKNRSKLQYSKWERIRTTSVTVFLFSLLFSFLIGEAYAELRSGMDADVVLGQSDFTTRTGRAGNAGLNLPNTAATDGKRLFVTDRNNHRVLVWNKIPTTNNEPADLVLGQPDFSTTVAGTTQTTFSQPAGIFTDGERLIITERGNHRVVIYNTIPTTSGAPADAVMGQTSFVAGNANQGGAASANTFNQPDYVFFDGARLYVADRNNNRVLVFNAIPQTNNASADLVIGQPDFTTTTSGVTQRKLNQPNGIFSDGKKLIVSDIINHRILVWNSIPDQNFTPADVVMGQPHFKDSAQRVGPNGLSFPTGLFFDGQKLFVADYGNSRILLFRDLPTSNFAPADLVLGQPDFFQNSSGTTVKKMFFVNGVLKHGGRLIVTEELNNRILIFNVDATSSNDLGPQFSQGKAVVGKVFFDWNGNGEQND